MANCGEEGQYCSSFLLSCNGGTERQCQPGYDSQRYCLDGNEWIITKEKGIINFKQIKDIKIIVTGSSMFDLKNKLGEPLTGRKTTFSRMRRGRILQIRKM